MDGLHTKLAPCILLASYSFLKQSSNNSFVNSIFQMLVALGAFLVSKITIIRANYFDELSRYSVFVRFFMAILEMACFFLASSRLDAHSTFSNTVDPEFVYVPTVLLILLVGTRCNDLQIQNIASSSFYYIGRWFTFAYILLYRIFLGHNQSNTIIDVGWLLIITFVLSSVFFISVEISNSNSATLYSMTSPLFILVICILLPHIISSMGQTTKCGQGAFYDFEEFRNAFQSHVSTDCDSDIVKVIKKITGVIAKLSFVFNAMILMRKGSMVNTSGTTGIQQGLFSLVPSNLNEAPRKETKLIDFEFHVIKTFYILSMAFLISSPDETFYRQEMHSISILTSTVIFLVLVTLFYWGTENAVTGKSPKNVLSTTVSQFVAYVLNSVDQLINKTLLRNWVVCILIAVWLVLLNLIFV